MPDVGIPLDYPGLSSPLAWSFRSRRGGDIHCPVRPETRVLDGSRLFLEHSMEGQKVSYGILKQDAFVNRSSYGVMTISPSMKVALSDNMNTCPAQHRKCL